MGDFIFSLLDKPFSIDQMYAYTGYGGGTTTDLFIHDGPTIRRPSLIWYHVHKWYCINIFNPFLEIITRCVSCNNKR